MYTPVPNVLIGNTKHVSVGKKQTCAISVQDDL